MILKKISRRQKILQNFPRGKELSRQLLKYSSSDPILFAMFQYMEQEGLSHLLQFLLAVDNFEELLAGQETYDGLQAQDDAMVLYDK